MASVNDSIPHLIRTANDPRQSSLHKVTISRIEQINPKIRLLRLSVAREGPALRHLPGQYIDLYIPGIEPAGGFTITSPPSTAEFPPSPSDTRHDNSTTTSSHSSLQENQDPYIELAIQDSPGNPPAAFLWRPASEILHKPLTLRVGGAFVYPPPTLTLEECTRLTRAIFFAGGVGINPIMSMISALHELALTNPRRPGLPRIIQVLYSVKSHPDRETVLFYPRLRSIASHWSSRRDILDFRFTLFETGANSGSQSHDSSAVDSSKITHLPRRIAHDDLLAALGDHMESRDGTVAYICGPAGMTDEFVDFLRSVPGLQDDRRVLCEKWW